MEYNYNLVYKSMDQTSDIYKDLKYLKGFGNSFHTEALPGAVPESTLSYN